jgi:hypothetical protein
MKILSAKRPAPSVSLSLRPGVESFIAVVDGNEARISEWDSSTPNLFTDISDGDVAASNIGVWRVFRDLWQLEHWSLPSTAHDLLVIWGFPVDTGAGYLVRYDI